MQVGFQGQTKSGLKIVCLVLLPILSITDVLVAAEVFLRLYSDRTAAFHDLRSGKPVILVIGDSFTQASQVSDEDTYYAIIKRRLDAEVFAYGAGGSGTLQEYMILDRYVDMIHPSLILWQFCLNDFINNDPALETASSLNNNGWRRPYWIDGRVEYVLPKTWTGSFRIWARRHSRLFYFLFSRGDKLLAMHPGKTVEDDIASEGLTHKGFQLAVQVTSELVQKARRRVGDVAIVAFSCWKAEPYDSAFKTISAQSDIMFFPDIAGALRAAHDRGEDVLHADMGHWSVEGHRLAGSLISEHLHDLFPDLFRPAATPAGAIPS